jgi:hypothetical protein
VRSYRITRCYVVPADGKAEAREILSEALASRLSDPEQYLDFESVREIVPEKPKSWRQELRNQLFGPSGAAKPAANGSRS